MVVLKDSDIFTTPADVWIFSSLHNSEYALKTDFFCNYIMAKGYAHSSPAPAEEVQEILKQSEMFLSFSAESIAGSGANPEAKSFLFSTHDRVPGKWILVQPRENLSSADWVRKSLNQAKKLKISSVKIFLPEDWHLIDVQDQAAENDIIKEFYFVSEAKENA